MASSFPSTANRGERRASVSPGLGDPSRSYRSPVAAYRDACLRLSSRAEEPRARGFACPAPHLLLALPVCLTLRSATFALDYCRGSRLVISLFTSGRQDLLKSEVRYAAIW
ncbi:unnamed protein product [Sphagnum troendelagicum]|uniref:Uncharacterized protein n=1 Tax=Sphagnum troendelagicum TaxID=128251 RepID=A0ABP0U0M2_9BRYO